MSTKGKLIVIEGLDGSGKATQSKLLQKKLIDSNLNVKKISFPDYTQPSSTLAKMYLNSEFGNTPESVNAYAASSFFAVDRYASFIKFWKKDYESGKFILADRYTTSNIVYNMCKLPKNNWDDYLNWVYDYEYNKLELPIPNFVIYLYVPAKVSQKLMDIRYKGDSQKKDLHEKNMSYQLRCEEAALYAIEKLGWTKINCENKGYLLDIEEIHDKVINSIWRNLND